MCPDERRVRFARDGRGPVGACAPQGSASVAAGCLPSRSSDYAQFSEVNYHLRGIVRLLASNLEYWVKPYNQPVQPPHVATHFEHSQGQVL